MIETIAPWIYFNFFVLLLLGFDLFVLHRRTRIIGIPEALGWSAFWISLALLFNVWIYFSLGKDAALNFFTGYLIEKSLSVDNLFVILLIFSYFRTPRYLQHKVLFWGILGAIIMRAIFIAAGITLIHYFEHILYAFAAFLIYAGIKMALKADDEEIDPLNNPVLHLIKKKFPVTNDYEGHSFFVRLNGALWVTPLFIVLMCIETTDILFAVDSIPAILAITTDPFIVYTSNIFAVLGLRSLFFALAGIMPLFHYMNYGLAFILTFVGIKMLLADWIPISTPITLAVTLASLLISILLSIIYPKPAQ